MTEADAPAALPDGPLHLVVLHHGLWGDPVHMEPIAQFLGTRRIAMMASQKPSGANEPHDGPESRQVDTAVELDRAASSKVAGDIVFLNIGSSPGDLGYDGIDICGDRCAQAVFERLEQLEGRVDRISLVGYSLGGLIVRYAAGKLYAAGVFDRIRPLNYVSIATPHLGTSRPASASSWNRTVNGIQSAVLARLGSQFLLKDDFRNGCPLLIVLADPTCDFHRALSRFSRRVAFANVRNDLTVKFTTAAIEPSNPFRRFRAIQIDAQRYPNIVVPSPSGDPVTTEPWTPRQIAYTTIAIVLSPVLVPLWFVLISTYLSSKARNARRRVSELVYDTNWLDTSSSSTKINGVTTDSSIVIPPAKDVAKIEHPQQRQWMVHALNSIPWRKVYVSIPFTNAHAAIVLRRSNPDAVARHKNVLEYLVNEMVLYE